MSATKSTSQTNDPLSSFTAAGKPSSKSKTGVDNFTSPKNNERLPKDGLNRIIADTAPKTLSPAIKDLASTERKLPSWVTPGRTLLDGPPPQPKKVPVTPKQDQQNQFNKMQIGLRLPSQKPVPNFSSVPLKGSSQDPNSNVYSPNIVDLNIVSYKHYVLPKSDGAYVLLAQASDSKLYLLGPKAEPASIADPGTVSKGSIAIKLSDGYEIKNLTAVFGINASTDEKSVNKVIQTLMQGTAINKEARPIFELGYAWNAENKVIENPSIIPGARVSPLLREFHNQNQDIIYLDDKSPQSPINKR